jgi:predicted amidohydrolase YtcJ
LAWRPAISRRARGLEDPLHPEEALNREQALRFYTINNAMLLFKEDSVGSLENGQDRGPRGTRHRPSHLSREKIAATHALRTYVGGKLVFNADINRPK